MSDDSDSDECLDLTSSRFNALKALYSKRDTVPIPRAPVLDNITKFEETEKGLILKSTPKPKIKNEPSQPSVSAPRFLPSQEPVAAKARRQARTVLTRMAQIKGPLSLLQRSMDQRVRIKVVVRNMAGVRGYCLGYLLAFDKHFNMALEDVTEVWTRRRRAKTPALGPQDSDDDDEVKMPVVKVLSRTAKTEVCERFVPKLLMRGEHVVLVSAITHS